MVQKYIGIVLTIVKWACSIFLLAGILLYFPSPTSALLLLILLIVLPIQGLQRYINKWFPVIPVRVLLCAVLLASAVLLIPSAHPWLDTGLLQCTEADRQESDSFEDRISITGTPVSDKSDEHITLESQVIESETPETKVPETKAPETKAPETKAPETKAPETKAPETKTPETKVPETKAPETKAPETKAPETKAPETKTPETKAPETKAPETKVPETKAPETKASETKAPETKAPETKAPETKAPETTATIRITHGDSSLTPEMVETLKGVAVFWAPTGKKIHLDPSCTSLHEVVYVGTIAEAQSAKDGGWCRRCAKEADANTNANPNATAEVIADCYAYADYVGKIPAHAFD